MLGASIDRVSKCESRVKGEQEHGGGKPPESIYEQSSVGAYVRSALDTRFLVYPVEERLNRLVYPADRLGSGMAWGLRPATRSSPNSAVKSSLLCHLC
jgi:hypothetical protein